jgi:excinuclease ABC subunit C
MMKSQELKRYKLPDQPGVYKFLQGRKLLYIGKATSLKDRVKSYFAGDLGDTRGPKLVKMLALATKIEWQATSSVLEALLLETELIKKHQPKYNSREKDDKSYNYIVITKEKWPRVLIVRGRELVHYLGSVFGPFTSGRDLKIALNLIRQIFPYRDKCLPENGKACFNYQIGLCPGVCVGTISVRDYVRTITNLKMFFSGKAKGLRLCLQKDMMVLAKKQEFEKANYIKKQLFALDHIQDVALISKEKKSNISLRIEAYDIAHLSGKNTTGAMTVWQDGELKKSEYKKFKLRGAKANRPDDPANLREILERRFNHPEWPRPEIIVVDGNQVQINVVNEVLAEVTRGPSLGSLKDGPRVAIIGVVKDNKHKASKLIGESSIIKDYHSAIVLVNSEAHRFALSYHRKLRARLV